MRCLFCVGAYYPNFTELQRVWCSMKDNMGGNLSLWVVSLHLGIDIVPGGGATHDL